MRDVDGNVDRMRIDLDHLPQVLAALDTTAAPVAAPINLQTPNGRSEQIDLTSVELDPSGAPVSAGANGSRRGVPVGVVSNGTPRGSHRAHGAVGNGWPTGADLPGSSADRSTGGSA